MSWQIVRTLAQVQVVRQTAQVQVGAITAWRVLRAASGPRGLAAAQDIGWTLSLALGPGEVLNSPPLPHPATYVMIYAHSDSGFAGARTLTVRQKRAGTTIASATLAVGSGAKDWSVAIAALAGAAGDVFALVLPSPADGQCTDLSVSLGSTP